MNRLKGVVLGVAFMALPAIASAQTINFDDVNTTPVPPNPVCPEPMLPNGYHGLNWDNFYVLKGSSYYDAQLKQTTYCKPPSGYRFGVVSPANVAFNGFGDPAAIWVSSGNTFTFNSVYMTAVFWNGLDVAVQGYLGGTLLHSQSFVLDTYTYPVPQFVFNWSGVDSVSFTPFLDLGSSNAHYIGDQTLQVAFDNLTVSDVTPEPATLLLLGTGLAGIGGVVRRRRQRNTAN